MMSIANVAWGAQSVLHSKNSAVVPGTLMLIAGSLVVYRHMTHEMAGPDNLKTFLGMIVLQMLPLVILEMKVISCADPVGLFCKFSGPVTLMHGIFLMLRVCTYPIYEHGTLWFSITGVLGVLVTIVFGFRQRWTLRAMSEYNAVWGLTILAFAAACCTELVEEHLNPRPSWNPVTWKKFATVVFAEANNYIELMAFVPAVWMLFREDQSTVQYSAKYLDVDSVDTKRRATAFFLFLVGFYFAEDIYQAYGAFWLAPVAAAAHIVHYLLLVDFAFYVLAHIYNPEKLVSELRKWLPKDVSVSV